MITDPEEQPHLVGTAECFDCEHSWLTVWPLGADNLECPNCHSRDTERERHGEGRNTERGEL